MSAVQFIYHTGLARSIFKNPRLVGSWDGNGRSAVAWSEAPMTAGQGEEGCDVFTASIEFDDSQIGRTFRWGVILDCPGGGKSVGDRNRNQGWIVGRPVPRIHAASGRATAALLAHPKPAAGIAEVVPDGN